jgi:hypothetical protein
MPYQISTSSKIYKGVFNRIGFTMLYMKSWVCPKRTYLEVLNNLCENCTDPNCDTCSNNFTCDICDLGYLLDSSTMSCLNDSTSRNSSIINSTMNSSINAKHSNCNGLIIIIPK